MNYITFNEMIEVNGLLEEKGLNFKVHLRDACGKQSCWIEPLGNCACHAHKEKVRLSHGLADFLHFVEHCLGGGGESRTPVRERSTQSFYRLRTSLDLVPPGAGAQAPKEPASRTILAKAPVGTCFRQPNEMRPTRVIGRPP